MWLLSFLIAILYSIFMNSLILFAAFVQAYFGIILFTNVIHTINQEGFVQFFFDFVYLISLPG